MNKRAVEQLELIANSLETLVTLLATLAPALIAGAGESEMASSNLSTAIDVYEELVAGHDKRVEDIKAWHLGARGGEP